MDTAEKEVQANNMYQLGLENVINNPEPKGQKFPVGSRVRIAENLDSTMSHFFCGKDATVLYTYAHAYGGNNIKSYSLDVDGMGDTAWYDESQLKEI